jgi:hypothetical protein
MFPSVTNVMKTLLNVFDAKQSPRQQRDELKLKCRDHKNERLGYNTHFQLQVYYRQYDKDCRGSAVSGGRPLVKISFGK